MRLSKKPAVRASRLATRRRLRTSVDRSCCLLAAISAWMALPLDAAANVVVSHDINTFGTFVAGTQEATFAVNVATYITAGRSTRNLLLFESNPGDGTRDFSTVVLEALRTTGFSVTVTSNYNTPFTAYDALFVAQDFPTVGFVNNADLISYAAGGRGIYLAGGVGSSASVEAAGWSTFLGRFGLAYVSSAYNGIDSVAITSAHPIFSGITSLQSGNGQSILDLGTNPNARIVQFAGTQGVYAVVDVPVSNVPEPALPLLYAAGVAALAAVKRWRRSTAG